MTDNVEIDEYLTVHEMFEHLFDVIDGFPAASDTKLGKLTSEEEAAITYEVTRVMVSIAGAAVACHQEDREEESRNLMEALSQAIRTYPGDMSALAYGLALFAGELSTQTGNKILFDDAADD